MGRFIFKELILGFPRLWKLYLTNALAFLLIFLLFGYMKGASRQLNYQNTIFSGEVTFHLKQVPRQLYEEEFDALWMQWGPEDRELISTFYILNEEDHIYRIHHVLNKEEIYLLEGIFASCDYQRLEENFEQRLKEKMHQVVSFSRKLHSYARYRGADPQDSGYAEIIGLEIEKEPELRKFLSLQEGHYPENSREALIPSSLAGQAHLAMGQVLRLEGQTARGTRNRGACKVVGIYNSPGLSFLFTPRILLNWQGMTQFYQPKEENIEYSLFFKNSQVPEDVNLLIRKANNDNLMQKISRIDTNFISILDVRNIGVQFNVFMTILIYITLFVIFSLVLIVNYNIYLIIFRKRRSELGALIASGVGPGRMGILLSLESLFQLLICLILGIILYGGIVFLTSKWEVLGILEIVLVLLTGTNKFYYILEPVLIMKTFVFFYLGVLLAQLPIFSQILFKKPIELLRRI